MGGSAQVIALPGIVQREVTASVVGDLAGLLVLHGDHPRVHEAAHVIDVMAAVARIMATDQPTLDTARQAAEAMACFCGDSSVVAMTLLADQLRSGGLSVEDVVRSLPDRVTDILTG